MLFWRIRKTISEFRKKMLEKCGIHNDIKVYVSNEYGVNKISGKLFRIVLNENNVNASKMLHIANCWC